jgi:hypothetical protein
MKMAGNRIIEFEEEGVKFILPQELDHVFVERLEPKDVGGDKNFTPNRYVINFRLFDKRNPGEEIGEFDPALTLLVFYDPKDLEYATGKDEAKPVLGIHYGARWHKPGDIEGKVTFDPVPKHERWIGFARVEIKTWDDPLISWGP